MNLSIEILIYNKYVEMQLEKSNYYDMVIDFLVTDISKGYDGDYDSDEETTTFPETNDSGN